VDVRFFSAFRRYCHVNEIVTRLGLMGHYFRVIFAYDVAERRRASWFAARLVLVLIFDFPRPRVIRQLGSCFEAAIFGWLCLFIGPRLLCTHVFKLIVQ